MKDTLVGPKSNKTVRTVIVIVVVIILVIIIYKIAKAIKDSGEALGEIVGMEIIQQKTGIVPARQRVCKSVAYDCENAITRVPFFGNKVWVADSEIVDALNRLQTPAEAALTCTFFKELAGESLKAVVEGGFFVEKNRAKISFRQYLI